MVNRFAKYVFIIHHLSFVEVSLFKDLTSPSSARPLYHPGVQGPAGRAGTNTSDACNPDRITPQQPAAKEAGDAPGSPAEPPIVTLLCQSVKKKMNLFYRANRGQKYYNFKNI